MISPPSLKSGDRVGVVAPSRMITYLQLKKSFEILEHWGLEVCEGKHLFDQHGYFAGTDAHRLQDLQKMINDPEVRGIFCARGGYGMSRIIDDLDLRPLSHDPKWIVGFSDITALHLALNKLQIQSIHGLMPVQFEYYDSESSLESLYDLLFKGTGSVEAPGHDMNRPGQVQAPIVGGNLSLLVDSLGTKTEIETVGTLLFLEEIDEYLYKVDRMLTQLKRAGKLTQLKALVLGDFTEMKDTLIPFGQEVEALILDKVKEFDYPVAFGFPLGHEIPNHSVPLLREVDLLVSHSGSMMSF